MSPFVTHVHPRWADIDLNRHVNHAVIVTLMEEARGHMLFTDSSPWAGFTDPARGLVVAKLTVDFRAPLDWTGKPVRVRVDISDLRPATFVMRHTVHCGPSEEDRIAAVGEVLVAGFHVATTRPRRLRDDEREFLAKYVVEDVNA
ncbi:acyl-CoA thioesterase [Allokutzneria sp. A3M-2-11 16]|uniref:acyl-CoA thioesterase n=1 Tax=Allokutzneria sp. A3M-2-11 16 TaxID=2962043 RepID=UPI0020B79BFA|nr:thioesterase family protein [Allokutzneria sp. A3M-2-11 16]MCP3800893.1 acyl-CoA thioesterase [Allokutzneria sp. A3M-2-11 16]